MDLLKVKIWKEQKNILWPIKKFQKYFMAHQYLANIFHDSSKNPPAFPPTSLMYGPLNTLRSKFISVFLKEKGIEVLKVVAQI